jgi:hypothetical protein
VFLFPFSIARAEEDDCLHKRNYRWNESPTKEQVKEPPPLTEIETMDAESAQEQSENTGNHFVLPLSSASLSRATVRARFCAFVKLFATSTTKDHSCHSILLLLN